MIYNFKGLHSETHVDLNDVNAVSWLRNPAGDYKVHIYTRPHYWHPGQPPFEKTTLTYYPSSIEDIADYWKSFTNAFSTVKKTFIFNNPAIISIDDIMILHRSEVNLAARTRIVPI